MPREPDPRDGLWAASLVAPTVQPLWDIPHAIWFTLMGVGGGVFLLARLLSLEARLGIWLGLPVVDLVSFAAIAAGGLVLIGTLGRPLRLLRAVLRPGSSWISRGAIADFVFLAAGGLLILPDLTLGNATPFSWLPWDASASGAAGRALEVVALASAAVVLFYAGQVLADPKAIPYWHSPAIPIQFVLSSLATSLGIVMLLETLNDEPIRTGQLWLLIGFLALLGLAIGGHLGTNTTVPGKAESLDRLLRGPFRGLFLGGVVAAGTLLPMILAVIGVASTAMRDAMAILVLLLTLPAGFVLRLLTLRAGTHPPVRAIVPVPKG